MIKKIYKIINDIAFLLILAGGISLFIYSFFILNLNKVTEGKLVNNVVMRFEAPTEFKVDKPFWWLTKGENKFLIRNDSDERYKGNLHIFLEGNPCKNKTTMLFDSKNFQKSVDIIQTRESITTFTMPFVVDPFSILGINATAVINEDCILNNGDIRNLAAKIVDYKFE